MSIGETLAAAREDRGLTVGQVSQTTRVRSGIIEALERDDFGPSGGDFYARGHIRAVAQAVGLDPVPLIAEFDAAYGHEPPNPVDVVETQTPVRRERRGGPNWSAAMVAALVVLLVVGGWQLLGGSGSGSAPPPVAEPTPSVTSSTTPSPTVTGSPSASSTGSDTGTPIAQVPSDGVTVRVAVAPTGRTWLAVTNAAGQTLYTGLLDAGQSMDFRDKHQLRLVVGNAGAVDLVVNGRDLGAPGGPGEVARLTFGPGDPQATAG